MTDAARPHLAALFRVLAGDGPAVPAVSAFGSASPPPAPPPPAVTPMPSLDDPAVLAQQAQASQSAAARSGLLSTILAGGGTGNYSQQKLGAQ